jgi:hypothetical protein
MNLHELRKRLEGVPPTGNAFVRVASEFLHCPQSRLDINKAILRKQKVRCPACECNLAEKACKVEIKRLLRVVLDGERMFCSSACSNSNKDTKAEMKQTLLDRYGVTNSAMTPAGLRGKARYHSDPAALAKTQKKIQRTQFARTGYTHHFHNPEVIARIQESYKQSRRITVRGKDFVVRGYEEKAIHFMLRKGISIDSVDDYIVSRKPDGAYQYQLEGRTRTYVPDFKVSHKGETFIVEVKSLYTAGLTDQDKAKHWFKVLKQKSKAVEAAGDKFVLLVFDQKLENPIAVCR